MPERTIDVNVSSNPSDKVTIEEENTYTQRKARLAEVYERGLTGDRLHVDLPPELYGEWVPRDVVSIHRKEALGFKIDTEYAPKRALHDKGDGASYVGDCVFMVCDREVRDILDELRQERYEQTHKPRDGKQKEEREFISNAGEFNAPTAESKARQARKEELISALQPGE